MTSLYVQVQNALALSLPAAGVVGGVGAAREQPDAALIRRALGPPLGNQDVCVAPGEFQSIADFRFFEVYAVDHFAVLANQKDGRGVISAAPPRAVAVRRLVRDALPFTRVFPVHLWG
jgi:hypothetical protein